MIPIPAGWKPIESVPENEGRPIFCLLAFGPEGDQSVGKGFRVNGKWYVGATFYCLGQEKSYEIREIEVQPTHWRSIPNLPGEESDTPPATTQDDPITVSLDPDPRGVSVGVWQGSHCIYNGAHAVPAPAAGDALDDDSDIPELRSEAKIGFEDWLTRQMPKGTVISNPAWWAPRILRAAERLIRAEEQLAAAPAAGDAQDDETRWTLRWIMHQADAAKETCGTDPESPAAIRNAKLAAISAAAAQALGLVRSPSYADSAGGDALDAARWRWVLSHAENVGFDYRSGRFTTLTVAGRQGDSLVAFVDAALAAQVPQQGEA